jgi:hypothetical protein
MKKRKMRKVKKKGEEDVKEDDEVEGKAINISIFLIIVCLLKPNG